MNTSWTKRKYRISTPTTPREGIRPSWKFTLAYRLWYFSTLKFFTVRNNFYWLQTHENWSASLYSWLGLRPRSFEVIRQKINFLSKNWNSNVSALMGVFNVPILLISAPWVRHSFRLMLLLCTRSEHHWEKFRHPRTSLTKWLKLAYCQLSFWALIISKRVFGPKKAANGFRN